jgi:hypothetical protein
VFNRRSLSRIRLPREQRTALQALDVRARQRSWPWVARYAGELERACPRHGASEQARRNRAALLVLAFLARVELGAAKTLEPVPQKHLFAAWPYSVRAWSLYSRCACVAIPRRAEVVTISCVAICQSGLC